MTYNNSKHNYAATKITKELYKSGENISERTVGNYMKEMCVRAQCVKLYTITTKGFDLSNELQNILDENFNQEHPNVVSCVIATINKAKARCNLYEPLIIYSDRDR